LLNRNKKVDLVILAGGEGTRIKKFLNGMPKPMIKFNNKHFLNYVINNFSKYNFNKIIILTRYKNNIIHKKYHNKIINFINIECIREKSKMGTGGALNLIKKKVNDFVLLNGDTLFDINLNDFMNSLNKKNLGTIALRKNNNQKSKKLNNLIIKKNHVNYSSKGNLMNGGIYFFKKKFLNFITKKKCSLENDVLPKLINDNKINGKIYNNFFIDIGSENFLKIGGKMLLNNFKKKAVFLDRDGVINYDYGYVHSIKKFKFRKGVIKGLQLLTKKKILIFIVTNQAGIGKRKFLMKDFIKLHKFLKIKLLTNNIFINDIRFSPFHKNATLLKFKRDSKFRKPGNLMIESLLKNWDINKKNSFMIGDKKSDYLAAKKSRINFYFAKNNFFKQIKALI